MDEERYNNRQIERLLDSQSTEIKEYMKLLTDPILEQVKKTNGRVTKLEDKVAVNTKYIWGIILVFTGAWGIVLAVIGGLVGNIKL